MQPPEGDRRFAKAATATPLVSPAWGAPRDVSRRICQKERG